MDETKFVATDTLYADDRLTVKPSGRDGAVLFIAETEQARTTIVLDRKDVVALCAHLGLLIGLTNYVGS